MGRKQPVGDFCCSTSQESDCRPSARRADFRRSGAGDQGVRELGVIVGEDLLEPGPVVIHIFLEASINRSVRVSRTWLAGRAPPNR